VVGGYLAFIGYFCFEAGVGLCIGKAIMIPTDWAYLGNSRMLTLAIPGMLAGLLITWVSRKVTHDAALPTVMVAIPIAFYVYMFVTGYSMDAAREDGWMGETSPPITPRDVFSMIKLEDVHWSLIKDCVGTWVGMVFVVSFSSCLDVAAISMDMGEALDTNQELTTVGISNCKYCRMRHGKFKKGQSHTLIHEMCVFPLQACRD
jgi:MFS superfamily sulfate permease-like transporter